MNETCLLPKPRDPRALNAYRHGLTGQVHIFTPEDRAAYEKHCNAIHRSLAPVNAMELDLVQSIADDRWRLRRAAAIENAIFAMGIGDLAEVDVALSMAKVWLEQGKSLQLLTLYESRIQRRVEKNLALLRQMQQDRAAALQKAAAEVELLTRQAAAQGVIYEAEREYPDEALPSQLVFSKPQIAGLAAHQSRLKDAAREATPRRKAA